MLGNKSMRGRRAQVLSLIFLLMVQFLFMTWYCNKKDYYHVDETYSYTLSNGYFNGFVSWLDIQSEWTDTQVLYDELTVSDEDAFAYDSVFDNQRRDVHPPLYYILLHTVCSFFRDTFSKWQGLSINLLFFVLTSILLYLSSREMTKGTFTPHLAVMMYGFSVGAISSVVFIRMYMMFAFFCTLDVYLHIRLRKNPEHTPALSVFVFLATIAGLLTQYYFVIFGFFLSAFFCLSILYKKRFRDLALYVFARLGGIFIAYAIFPAMIDHVFNSYRGVGTLSGKALGDFFDLFMQFYTFVGNDLFATHASRFLAIPIVLAIAVGAYSLISKKCAELREYVREISPVFCLAIISFLYVSVISFIAPYMTARYIYNVYPFICLCFIATLDWALRGLRVRGAANILALAMVITFISTSGYTHSYVDYLYKDSKHPLQIEELKKHNGDFLVLYPKSYKYEVNYDLFYYFTAKQICFVPDEDLQDLSEIVGDHAIGGLKLKIYTKLDVEKTLALAQEATGLMQADFIGEVDYAQIYYLH